MINVNYLIRQDDLMIGRFVNIILWVNVNNEEKWTEATEHEN